jgi:hypothetical protein
MATGGPMRRVMIACERTSAAVSTGIVMNEPMLDDLNEDAVFTFRCPDCGELHSWQKPSAWLEDLHPSVNP